ncbi:hypothetical protein ACFSHT_29115 [Paraburkholderia silviterrae]|uniref:Uncharacterized protein n=1 Tax=Paraburkholderia silviterrae TaxID=2528715 RepID=A0A4R5M6B1_9BURK|nr:hypothetical protein [Paraburkholderia silviterrae]TDG21116.1 hypothetical protein EYW47_22340 [Paraburkholderia silviterrae]
MAAKTLRLSAFNAKRLQEGWTRIAELSDFSAFTNFVNYSANENHARFGSFVMKQVKDIYLEVQKQAGPEARNPGPIAFILDEGVNQKFVSLVKTTEDTVLLWSFDRAPFTAFRRTKGIVSNDGNPETEADVIMTAVTLGFAGAYIAESGSPIQFDMDPLEGAKEPAKTKQFEGIVGKMDSAVAAYLTKTGKLRSEVKAGLSPGYSEGAVIMGVYSLAGKNGPKSVSAPVLSEKGKALWEKIRTLSVAQYTGRGAYTGFVDNKNTEGDTDPVGPRSTARFRTPRPRNGEPGSHPRWLPPADSPLWEGRKRADSDTLVPWGLIGGERAGVARGETGNGALNEADLTTISIRSAGMAYVDDVTTDDIAAYTHGMIQAIYKAYHLGPACEPYEIAVGDVTKKMASCLTCTLFMNAAGYPPTSIHLGRGESWAPLYRPYNPNGSADEHEAAVIRDLNNAWYAKCLEWLKTGLAILDDTRITKDHQASRDAVSRYLDSNQADPTVGGVLVLDAVTIHAGELDRLGRTLK